jgi:uncharacterized coiled-coil protein SlyX
MTIDQYIEELEKQVERRNREMAAMQDQIDNLHLQLAKLSDMYARAVYLLQEGDHPQRRDLVNGE